MTTPKNPAAVALQALRKTKTGGRNGGPPLRYPRCPCAAMTAARAAQRNHRCTADIPKPA